MHIRSDNECIISHKCLNKQKISLGAKDLVTCVAEAWQDVSDLIQNGVDAGAVNFYVRVLGVNSVDALHNSYEDDRLDLFAAFGLEQVDCCDDRAASGEHWINNDSNAVFDVRTQLIEVVYGLQGLLVTVETDH